MTGDDEIEAAGTIAPLSNVMRFSQMLTEVLSRPLALPGFAVFDGPAGLGKSFAAMFAANRHRAHVLRLESCTTQRGFMERLAAELGLRSPARSIEGIAHQIADHLIANPHRPIILDEADHLARRGIIELVRDIHDIAAPAGAAIAMIGETGFYAGLKRWERVQSRVLVHEEAKPLTARDVELLSKLILGAVDAASTARVSKAAGGSARRAVTALYAIKREQDAGALDVA